MPMSIEFLPKHLQEIKDIQNICELIDQIILIYFFRKYEQYIRKALFVDCTDIEYGKKIFQKIQTTFILNILSKIYTQKKPLTEERLHSFLKSIVHNDERVKITLTYLDDRKEIQIKFTNGELFEYYEDFITTYLPQILPANMRIYTNFIYNNENATIRYYSTETIQEYTNNTIKELKRGI